MVVIIHVDADDAISQRVGRAGRIQKGLALAHMYGCMSDCMMVMDDMCMRFMLCDDSSRLTLGALVMVTMSHCQGWRACVFRRHRSTCWPEGERPTRPLCECPSGATAFF